VKFPSGFELTPGTTAEVSLNSNHPKHAVIRVPVIATPAVVPGSKVSG
jgi:hypothetical protein